MILVDKPCILTEHEVGPTAVAPEKRREFARSKTVQK